MEETTSKKTKRTTARPADDKRLLTNRLNRIEGQVQGIRRMIERDAYCPDILVQVSAVNSALHAVSRMLLENHMKSCIAVDLKDGKKESMEELVKIFPKVLL